MLASIVLYTLLFFRLRGNIHVDPQNWKRIRIRLHRDPHTKPSLAGREAMGVVIWYPICYSITVVPMIVVRWLSFHPIIGVPIPFEVTAFVITLFGFSGVFSVMLILLTRRDLLLLGSSRGLVNY